MFLDLKKTLFLVGTSALLFSACGDDGGGDTVDAAVDDDAGPDIDAMPSTAFEGTVSLAEVRVTNQAGVDVGASGAAAILRFTAPVDANPPHPDFDNNVGECKVTIIDISMGESLTGSNGGDINVKGTNADEFNCAYDATLDEYLCTTADAAGSGAMLMAGTLMDGGNGGTKPTVELTVPGADFSGTNYRGMYIVLAGFSTPEANGIFPILADKGIDGGLADNQLTLQNINALATGDHTLAADSGYKTLVGAGPIAGGYDFLDDGAVPLVIAKPAATDSVALASTLAASGEGFALSDASVQPHLFPATGDALFSCEGAGGVCGPEGTGTGTILHGIVVFGETTDDTLGASFSDMPEPKDKFVRFQCTGLNLKSITIPSAAVDLINSTGHTRIQTSVTYASAQISPAASVVVGQGVIGFTDAQ